MAPRVVRVLGGRLTAALSQGFAVDQNQVVARWKAAACPLLWAKSKVLHELKMAPDLWATLWVPSSAAFACTFGHPGVDDLPSFFAMFGLALAMLYVFVAVAAGGAWVLLRALRLRPQWVGTVSIASYACAPWGLWCGTLFHRLPRGLPSAAHADALPAQELLLVAVCAFATAFTLVSLAQWAAAVDRPDLSGYRSRAMAVLRLEATQHAMPLPALKAVAGARSWRSWCTVRNAAVGSVLCLFAVAVNVPMALLMYEHMTGAWGATGVLDTAWLQGVLLRTPRGPPPPPAFAKVADVADLHGQYVKNMMRLKDELEDLKAHSEKLHAASQDNVAKLTASLVNATDNKLASTTADLNSRLQQVMAMLQQFQEAAAVPPAANNLDTLMQTKEEALAQAGEVQDALLWMAKRKVERARQDGAPEIELVRLEKEMMMLKRERAQMQNEERFRQFQRDPLGTHAAAQAAAHATVERRRAARAKAAAAAAAVMGRPPGEGTVAAARHTSPGEREGDMSKAGELHGLVAVDVATAERNKRQRTSELLRRLGRSVGAG